MTLIEIADLFIRAAFIDSRLPINARPKALKGSWIPFVHTEQEIKDRRVTLEAAEKLHPGDDPLHDWRYESWLKLEDRISRADVGLWEQANDLITLVTSEENRRALWAWSRAKADCLTVQIPDSKGRYHLNKISFAHWCRIEGICEMTGSRRKNRAIAIINQRVVRGVPPDAETGAFGVLPVGAVFEHISVNIGDLAASNEARFTKRDADTVFCKNATVFDWRQRRNADRKRREQARKKLREAA